MSNEIKLIVTIEKLTNMLQGANNDIRDLQKEIAGLRSRERDLEFLLDGARVDKAKLENKMKNQLGPDMPGNRT